MRRCAFCFASVLIVAAPDRAPVFIRTVPYLAAVKRTAVAADDARSKTASSAVSAIQASAPRQFLLCQIEYLRADDGGMAVLRIILGHHAAVVYHKGFQKIIRAIRFLQDRVALVFFVGKDVLHCGRTPAGGFLSRLSDFSLVLTQQTFSGGAGNAGQIEFAGDHRRRCTLQKAPKNGTHDVRLCFHNLRRSVLAAAIAHKLSIGHGHFPVCEAFPYAPGHIFRNIAAFLLRNAGHDGQQHLAFAVQRVDVLFLKIDLHAVFLQFSDGGQCVHRVSCEAGDALGDNQVDPACQRVLNHAVKPLALFGAHARNALIRVHIHELPVVRGFLGLDIFGIVLHLRLITGQLFFAAGGDAGVSRHASGARRKGRNVG